MVAVGVEGPLRCSSACSWQRSVAKCHQALGYSANSNVLMVSFMSRSGLERMTTKKRAKRALSSFKGATPLVVLFFLFCFVFLPSRLP